MAVSNDIESLLFTEEDAVLGLQHPRKLVSLNFPQQKQTEDSKYLDFSCCYYFKIV